MYFEGNGFIYVLYFQQRVFLLLLTNLGVLSTCHLQDRNYEQKYKESETYSNRTFSISTQDVNILKGYSNNINDFHSSDNGNYCDNPSDQDIKYISSSHIVKSKSSENLLSLKNSINELANAIRDNTSTILDKPSRQFSRISRFSRRNTPSGNTKGIREIRTAPNSLRWKDKKEGISGMSLIFYCYCFY